MKMLCLAVLATLLSGCATHSRFNDTGAGIMAWRNDLSAALVVPAANSSSSPKACMQMALAMNDVNSKVTANLSDSVLKVFEKIPSNSTPEDVAKVNSELIKTAKALNVSTERTAFLLVGSFYLCQYQANGMSDANLASLATTLIKSAASIEVK